MRKFVLSAVALCFSLGLTLAADVVFVKFDKEKKELTVKDGDAEKTYMVTDDTKFKRGDEEVPADKAFGALEKAKEGKTKLAVEVDGKKLKEVKMMAKKK